MKRVFPNTIYAYTERDADDEYIVAFVDPGECVGIGEEKVVGKYVLESTVKVSNYTEVVKECKD